MAIRHEPATHFMDEVRIVPPWAYAFAVLGFAVVAAAVVFATLTDNSHDTFYSLPVLVPLGIFAGSAIACYILLIGYVNRDANRRGMSPLAWTLLAVLIPNALGIVVYFVLRKPRLPKCPQCSSVLEPGFGFCPRCRFRLTPVCPQCHRSVHVGDKFCPYCGGELAIGVSSSVPVSTPS